MTDENSDDLTCFQRRLPSPNLPPPRLRRRSKPMTMITRRMTSLINIVTTVNLLLLILGVLQLFSMGSHSERTCGWSNQGDLNC